MPLNIPLGTVVCLTFLVQIAHAFASGGLALQQHQNQLLRQQSGADPGGSHESAHTPKKTLQMRTEIDRLRKLHTRRPAPEYNHRVGAEGRKAAELWLRREAAVELRRGVVRSQYVQRAE